MRGITQHIYKRMPNVFLHYATLLFIVFGFSSCINDDLSDCQTDFLLQIKVINSLGENITSSGEAGNVELYVFGNNQQYLDHITVPAQDVINLRNVHLNYTGNGDLWIVVWSNLNGKQQVTSLSNETTMDEALVQLIKDTNGYAQNPDDLFFGIKKLNNARSKTPVTVKSEVVMERKTALMNVTVKGLDAKYADEYYLVITGAEEDAYNFKGSLVGNTATYRQPLKLNTLNSFYISENPFTVYPLSQGNRLSISVYRGQELIITVNTNEDGSDIIPITGVTNNVLIDISSTLNVVIEVTSWQDIYHWVEW